ncbi:hypothetical protein GGI08_002416 [Coemansia sp. S2]|nr:hypothetical protein GGI08_002416 [Coemansia sp. S2]
MAAMIIQACTDTAYTYVTLPNDMPESPPTAKCQQLNQQVCNGAAQVTTSKDLMEVPNTLGLSCLAHAFVMS